MTCHFYTYTLSTRGIEEHLVFKTRPISHFALIKDDDLPIPNYCKPIRHDVSCHQCGVIV